jgi:hypothetical protein
LTERNLETKKNNDGVFLVQLTFTLCSNYSRHAIEKMSKSWPVQKINSYLQKNIADCVRHARQKASTIGIGKMLKPVRCREYRYADIAEPIIFMWRSSFHFIFFKLFNFRHTVYVIVIHLNSLTTLVVFDSM